MAEPPPPSAEPRSRPAVGDAVRDLDWAAPLAHTAELLGPVTLRPAGPPDHRQLRQLAQLDCQQPLPEPVILAELDGRLACAVSLSSGRLIADPFRRTTRLAQLLRLHCDLPPETPPPFSALP